MNNFGIANFSWFLIDAWNYIFKAIILIHAAFFHKIKVFSKVLYLSNLKHTAYFVFFTYFYFQHCLRNDITGDIKNTTTINVYFYLTVPFCLKDNIVVHRWKAYENNLRYNLLITLIYIAAFVVDGKADLQYCSETLSTYEPWWAMDLQTRYTLLNISLTYPSGSGTSMRFIHSWLIYWNTVHTWRFFLSHNII